MIDQLLHIVHDKGGAHASLLLAPGREARLRSGARERPLTRSPLDGATIHRLLREVAPQPPDLHPGAAGHIEFRYPFGTAEFLVSAVGGEGGWHVSARQTATSANGKGTAKATGQPETARPSVQVLPSLEGMMDATATTAVAAAPPVPAPAVAPMRSTAAAATPRAEAPPAVGVQAAGPLSASETSDLQPLPSIPDLLRALVAAGGSDLHLTSQQPPRQRVDGDLMVIPGYAGPSPERLRELLWEITPQRNRDEFEARNDSDFAYELPGSGRFRVNLFRDRLGVGSVMRQIPEKIPSADDLGLSPAIRRLAALTKGLVLVTGPTGSGKSTTLAALVDLVNRTRNDHIITIEDPVEFVHPSRSCLVNQREVHVHTDSFKQALRAALREDPDVVLVGELRDLETIAIAIETAETGHLVFGTLHTTTAISTVERIVDQFPGDRQEQVRMMLADSLKAVIAQTLLKKKGGGRVAAQEVLLANPAVSNLIREGKTFQLASAMQTGRSRGMILLNDALLELVKGGTVEPLEAYRKAVDKESLLKAFKAADIEIEVPGE